MEKEAGGAGCEGTKRQMARLRKQLLRRSASVPFTTFNNSTDTCGRPPPLLLLSIIKFIVLLNHKFLVGPLSTAFIIGMCIKNLFIKSSFCSCFDHSNQHHHNHQHQQPPAPTRAATAAVVVAIAGTILPATLLISKRSFCSIWYVLALRFCGGEVVRVVVGDGWWWVWCGFW